MTCPCTAVPVPIGKGGPWPQTGAAGAAPVPPPDRLIRAWSAPQRLHRRHCGSQRIAQAMSLRGSPTQGSSPGPTIVRRAFCEFRSPRPCLLGHLPTPGPRSPQWAAAEFCGRQLPLQSTYGTCMLHCDTFRPCNTSTCPQRLQRKSCALHAHVRST